MMAPRKRGGEGEAARLRSAGGVVAAGEGAELRVAVMRSAHGTWVFPKGGIEEGETYEEAARREIEEEIGLRGLASCGELGWTEHEFERGGERVRKRVEWFLFVASQQEHLRADPTQNVMDCGWFRPEQALSLLGHRSQRMILRKALARLDGAGAG